MYIDFLFFYISHFFFFSFFLLSSSSFLFLLFFLFCFVESQYVSGFTQKPQGYWSMKNRRYLLEEVAKNMNFDPLHPDSWYQVVSESSLPNKVSLPSSSYYN